MHPKRCVSSEVLSLFSFLGTRHVFGPVLGRGQPLRGCAFAGVSPVLAGGFSGVLGVAQPGAQGRAWSVRGGRLRGVFKPFHGASSLVGKAGGSCQCFSPQMPPAVSSLASGVSSAAAGFTRINKIEAEAPVSSLFWGQFVSFRGFRVEHDGRFKPRAAGASLGREGAMPDLSGYCLNRNQESRILNALWGALHDDWPRLRDWHPSPGEVAGLRLEVVIGLGFVGQEIVRLWLEDKGFPRKTATRGPATKPGWVSQDKRWAKFDARSLKPRNRS